MEKDQQIRNMHGDHAASCLCCKNLELSIEEDWSELTPGGVNCYCREGADLFEYQRHRSVDRTDFHDLQMIGARCIKFQPAEEAGWKKRTERAAWRPRAGHLDL